MSNLRSDARHHSEGLPVSDYSKTLIERLCHQLDKVEESWHSSQRTIVKLSEEVVDTTKKLADSREAVRVLGEGVSLLGIAQVRLEIPRYEGLHERIDKAMSEINDNPTAAAAVESAKKRKGE